MSAENLLIILLVGGIAGWLAGLIVQGTGFGLVADIALGIVGSFLGAWLLPRLGLHIGSGLIGQILVALIGAIILLLLLGLLSRGGGGGRGLFLTPPSYPIFIISVAIAVIALLSYYGGMHIPTGPLKTFDLLTIAYVVLLIGVVFSGL